MVSLKGRVVAEGRMATVRAAMEGVDENVCASCVHEKFFSGE